MSALWRHLLVYMAFNISASSVLTSVFLQTWGDMKRWFNFYLMSFQLPSISLILRYGTLNHANYALALNIRVERAI